MDKIEKALIKEMANYLFNRGLVTVIERNKIINRTTYTMAKTIKRKYICNDCGYETDEVYKGYEHLNESSEEDKIYQEGMDKECESFWEVSY